jgi:tRNA(adenine34) deaminase
MDPAALAAFAGDERWMAEALREAADARDAGEVPVGAVVVRDGVILGRGRNQVEGLHDPTAHAEVLAIGAAAGAAGDWRLDGATLYVTLEPCTMCCGALLLARIGRVVFGAADPRAGSVVSTARLLEGNPYRQRVQAVGGIAAAESGALLAGFFRRARDGGGGGC